MREQIITFSDAELHLIARALVEIQPRNGAERFARVRVIEELQSELKLRRAQRENLTVLRPIADAGAALLHSSDVSPAFAGLRVDGDTRQLLLRPGGWIAGPASIGEGWTIRARKPLRAPGQSQVQTGS
jgi:hypothetical protein